MNRKAVVQVALFAVLGASLLAWGFRTFSGSGLAAPAPIAAAPEARARPAAPLVDGVVVYSFHGTRR
jgi:hypothetical protein